MPNRNLSEPAPGNEPDESFGSLLSQFERSRTAKRTDAGREGTVISVSADSVYLDIGFKTEGVLPLSELKEELEAPKPGDKVQVTIKGRDPGGYYELTRAAVARPTDWEGLQKAFVEKATILGRVMGVVKGGLSVDIGVRAFMPASRSGTREAAEMAELVEQEVRCRIIKLDSTDEDVVVDRRIVLEEERLAQTARRYSELREGDMVSGTVRSLTPYGAFIDIGGIDALLHVADISWSRIADPADALEMNQSIEARILKIDVGSRRVSIGMKQLLPIPWESASEKYKAGDRVRATVTRVTDFGAFAEVEPGVEGLIHVSEMSWARKVRRPSDVVKPGHTVEVVVLAIDAGERRMSLGLKQALGDPWARIAEKLQVGCVIEGPVVNVTKFGAFVQVEEGVEGMIHVSDITAEKRIHHPQDVLKIGQPVKALVMELDSEKRRMKLSIRHLVPTSIDEYLAEHNEGDEVSGRVVEISGASAAVEVGEGIQGTCRVRSHAVVDRPSNDQPHSGKPDLSSLGSMLSARWKTGAVAESSRPGELVAGQVRRFRIARLDRSAKQIELEVLP
ncbi:MAG: S1 RNA-binding domain-containing protein [Acidobacteria bacterium]|nr:S1 RNA-binding domain-containing protein [Acidobacteriota bacterium]